MECVGSSAPFNPVNLCNDKDCLSAELTRDDLDHPHLPQHRSFKARKLLLIRDIGRAWTAAKGAIEKGDKAISEALASYAVETGIADNHSETSEAQGNGIEEPASPTSEGQDEDEMADRPTNPVSAEFVSDTDSEKGDTDSEQPKSNEAGTDVPTSPTSEEEHGTKSPVPVIADKESGEIDSPEAQPEREQRLISPSSGSTEHTKPVLEDKQEEIVTGLAPESASLVVEEDQSTPSEPQEEPDGVAEGLGELEGEAPASDDPDQQSRGVREGRDEDQHPDPIADADNDSDSESSSSKSSSRASSSSVTTVPPSSTLCFQCNERLQSPCWYCLDCTSESFV